MNENRRNQFLSAPRIAVLATVNDRARVHLSPVWYEWDGSSFTLHHELHTRKLAHIRGAQLLSICVEERKWPYAYMTADCRASVDETVPGFPRRVAERYLAGQDLDQFMRHYGASPCAVVRAVPYRWSGT